MSILEVAEGSRVMLLEHMKVQYGQFFTPASLAERVVCGLRFPGAGALRMLDLGAGAGALTAAVARLLPEGVNLQVTCVELDADLLPHLSRTLAGLDHEIIHGDALSLAAQGMLREDHDVVVMNPPYGKLAASSEERRAMAQLGVDVPNIYAAFMAIGYLHLRQGGQMAAIVPRSWTNGPYFKRFREHMLAHVSLDRIQAFASRSALFSEAKVLQENVIVTCTRSREQGEVELIFDDAEPRRVPFEGIVHPRDAERFVRIPTGRERELPGAPLGALGLRVSTGKVVDFRAREHLAEPGNDTYPMIYQGNIHAGRVVWPRDIGKAQGFRCAPEEFRKFLVPPGAYVVVKRFSAKEEKRRVVAAVHEATTHVAYDNKTNVFPCPDRDVAVGLAYWLNSTAVDDHFRAFSGHTQVNATDLRTMPYPSLEQLRILGGGRDAAMPDQAVIDAVVEHLL